MTLILASKSQSRGKILSAAGLQFSTIVSGLDEAVIKDEMLGRSASFQALAETLATEKAKTVSFKNPQAVVIGADQMLICEGKPFDKARSIEEAIEHLQFFRGKTHKLVTSVAIVRNNETIWTFTSEPKLTMRNFSDQFLDYYIKVAGDALLHSVGVYFLEDVGINLFSKIEGDYYEILGMPLLPLLKKLRDLKIIDD